MLAPRSPTATDRRPPLDRVLPDDVPELSFQVEIASSGEELEQHRSAWERLVATAIEPNVFFEPALLIPAVDHLAGNDKPEIGLVFARQRRHHEAERVLCGLFPLVRHVGKGIRRIPMTATWLHQYAFLGTPLIRSDCPHEILAAFLDWLASTGRGRVIYFPRYHGGGAFAECLATVMQQRGHVWFVQQQVARSQFQPAASAEDFLRQVWSSKKRQDMRRLKRHLAKLGELSVRALQAGDNVSYWIDSFLALEASGWKGRNQTALDSHESSRRFIQQAFAESHDRGQLHMLSIELDGKPIAMNSAFFTGNGGYYFKIAYDEAYAKYSPGVVLEAESLEVLHNRPELAWLDSCAEVNHPMIESLWDRRTLIESAWVSTGRASGDLLAGAIACASGVEKLARRFVRPLYHKWIKHRAKPESVRSK